MPACVHREYGGRVYVKAHLNKLASLGTFPPALCDVGMAHIDYFAVRRRKRNGVFTYRMVYYKRGDFRTPLTLDELVEKLSVLASKAGAAAAAAAAAAADEEDAGEGSDSPGQQGSQSSEAGLSNEADSEEEEEEEGASSEEEEGELRDGSPSSSVQQAGARSASVSLVSLATPRGLSQAERELMADFPGDEDYPSLGWAFPNAVPQQQQQQQEEAGEESSEEEEGEVNSG